MNNVFRPVAKQRRRTFATFGAVAILVAATAFFSANRVPQTPKNFVEIDAAPTLYPDYSDVALPFNIAPINFKIEEDAKRFVASISSKSGAPIILSGKTIDIPLNRWKRLTSENVGEALAIQIFAKKNGTWTKYRPIANRISRDPIDRFLYYRFIEPRFEYGNVLTLRQRDLESFVDEAFFSNESVGGGPCMNGHSFQNRQTERFLFHYRHFDRPELGGTIFVDGKKSKNSTRASRTASRSPIRLGGGPARSSRLAPTKRANFFIRSIQKNRGVRSLFRLGSVQRRNPRNDASYRYVERV